MKDQRKINLLATITLFRRITNTFEKSRNDPLELVILIASFYGLRRSEVLGLKWSAFDFINDTITIKHKVIETIVDDKKNTTSKR